MNLKMKPIATSLIKQMGLTIKQCVYIVRGSPSHFHQQAQMPARDKLLFPVNTNLRNSTATHSLLERGFTTQYKQG